MKYALVIAAVVTLGVAAPACADDVGIGVGVGPVGAGVTVGTSHYDRHERDRTTVIREHEPRDKTVIIKKDRDRHPDRKVIIHDDD